MAADDPHDEQSRVPHITGNGDRATVTLRDHLEAIRVCDVNLQAERDQRYKEVGAERDQRYAEVKAAEEKALKVKETADLKALDLASQIQTYKDEKANELREQISSERGLYVTRTEMASAVRELQAAIKPLAEFATSWAAREVGTTEYRAERRLDTGQVLQALVTVAALITLLVVLFHK